MIAKLIAAYQRMSQRERIMTLAVAAILFLLINIFIWKWLLGTISGSRSELAARKSTRSEQTVYLRERELWAKRDQWLQNYFARSTQTNRRQIQHCHREPRYRHRRDDPESSGRFRFHRNQQPLARAGSFSLRCSTTGRFHCL